MVYNIFLKDQGEFCLSFCISLLSNTSKKLLLPFSISQMLYPHMTKIRLVPQKKFGNVFLNVWYSFG